MFHQRTSLSRHVLQSNFVAVYSAEQQHPCSPNGTVHMPGHAAALCAAVSHTGLVLTPSDSQVPLLFPQHSSSSQALILYFR